MNKEFEQLILIFKQMTRNIEVEYTCSPIEWDKQRCGVFLTTAHFIGNMTVWDSNECEMEIIKVGSGDKVVWDYSILKASEELKEKFEQFSRVFLDDINLKRLN